MERLDREPPAWLDRVSRAIRERFNPYFIYRFFGHLIYKPVERARWKIPAGMTTLKEFLRFAESRGLEQKRRDHPIALEVYIIFTLNRKITDTEIMKIKEILQEMVLDALFHPDLLDYMEYGYEEEPSTAVEPADAGLRYSRDGIEWVIVNSHLKYTTLRKLGGVVSYL
jgi:hypothetical protein